MADYSSDHAGALVEVKEAGAAVAFTVQQSTYDPETDTHTSVTTSSVKGYAMQVDGTPKEYERLGLTEMEAPTLLFVANRYGDTPELNAVGEWGGVRHTVKSVRPFAPDGTAILSYVIVQR